MDRKQKRAKEDESVWLRIRRWYDCKKNGKSDAIPSPDPDPAAAPLGTDQEAGGSATTPYGERYGRFGPGREDDSSKGL